MFTLRDIVAGYEQTQVLNRVSIDIPAKSVVALLGSNGAGKSTLLKVAAGLLRPSSGEVTMGGHAIADLGAVGVSGHGVCLVPEGRAVFPNLTVSENLAVLGGPRPAPGFVADVVDLFPVLGKRLKQLAGTLSGGEQQMLALSRAYSSHNQVVLIDEISMGLAPIVVDSLYESIAQLRSRGKSLLVVEQYAAKAIALADWVYILDRGRIAVSSRASEVDADRIMTTYLGQGTDAADRALDMPLDLDKKPG